ncbi:MAG: universal stress protein [Lactovum sp.]
MKKYQKIIIGIDGSEEAEKAFEKAVDISLRNDAELVLANIIDLRIYQSITSYGSSTLAQDTEKSAEKLMQIYLDKAKERGLEKVKVRVEFGSPKTMLGQTLPNEEKADLILLGSTNLSDVERFFIGSVANYIINHAPCDTLIVRP